MKEYNLSDEMILMFECVKSSGDEELKKGLKDFFDVMEKLHAENELLRDKIDKQHIIIEKQEQEKFRLICKNRKSNFEKLTEAIQKFGKVLKSQKSGF